jgi:hypothetical protein
MLVRRDGAIINRYGNLRRRLFFSKDVLIRAQPYKLLSVDDDHHDVTDMAGGLEAA